MTPCNSLTVRKNKSADITVYNNAKPAGKATCDATRTAGRNKFIDADKKIAELVNQLFQGGAGY